MAVILIVYRKTKGKTYFYEKRRKPSMLGCSDTKELSLPPKGTSGMETDVLTDISNMIDEDADLKKALQMSLGTGFNI